MSEGVTKEDVIARFGVDPEQVGNRPRGWWILDSLDETDEWAGAQVGDLCVKTRDGGGNPIDPEAFRIGQCVGSMQDSYDCTYRYYYYRALPTERPVPHD